MPLFGNRTWKIPKSKERKAEYRPSTAGRSTSVLTIGDSTNSISLALDGVSFKFEHGKWIHDVPNSREAIEREIVDSRAKIKKAEEEKNMYKVKLEILLDILAVNNSEIAQLRNENTNLRRILEKFCPGGLPTSVDPDRKHGS